MTIKVAFKLKHFNPSGIRLTTEMALKISVRC